MERKEEYHDPDYPESSTSKFQENSGPSDEEKIYKIKQIIRREFVKEIEAREKEVLQIDQNLITSRRTLHRLRYALVSDYYQHQKLQLSQTQIQDEISSHQDPTTRTEVSAILRDRQRRLHPSVRKLVGKTSVDLHEILKSREPRSKTKKNYYAMFHRRSPMALNTTTPADSCEPLREPPQPPPPQPPRKVPRHMEPRQEKVLTLDPVTRNKMKHRYRFIIGNTSAYSPGASPLDRSTHKWLLYVRAPPAALAALKATLHHSYAPHHALTLTKPPFHISRRGWGEFPAKLELHFPLPELNRPALVEHTIRLDRNYTGLQTLGGETVVDVWLYSTPEMLEHQHREEPEEGPREEPPEEAAADDWRDFFAAADENLDADEPADEAELLPREEPRAPDAPPKRIMKYMDPATGKIYYLEMDRALDVSKVQEITFNAVKLRISPAEPAPEPDERLAHIENDHCYLAPPRRSERGRPLEAPAEGPGEAEGDGGYALLCAAAAALGETRAAVALLLRRLPLVAAPPALAARFAFAAPSLPDYWRMDAAKRRSREWARAKAVARILAEQRRQPAWRPKQILVFARLHGLRPERPAAAPPPLAPLAPLAPRAEGGERCPADVRSAFDARLFLAGAALREEAPGADEEVDVEAEEGPPPAPRPPPLPRPAEALRPLPVADEDERLRFLFLQKTCADIGVELRSEDVGSGYCYSAVHAVLASALRSFADELLRGALAEARLEADEGPHPLPSAWAPPHPCAGPLRPRHVLRAVRSSSGARRLSFLTALFCAAPRPSASAPAV